MKIDLKQTKVRPLFFKIFFAFFAVALFFFLTSSVGYAPTRMSDSELSEIEGQAFFKIEHFGTGVDFWTTPTVISSSYNATYIRYDDYPVFATYHTGSQNVIRISMAIDVEAHAHIDSQKMGYHPGQEGGVAGDTNGWDQDHTYFWVGDRPTSGYGTNGEGNGPLILQGLYIDLGYDNVANATSRVLNYIEIGSQHVTGNVTQTIGTINGLVMGAGGTGQNDGVMLRQTASGTRVVNFNNEVMAFVFAAKYRYEDHQSDATNVSGIFLKIPSYDTSDDLLRP